MHAPPLVPLFIAYLTAFNSHSFNNLVPLFADVVTISYLGQTTTAPLTEFKAGYEAQWASLGDVMMEAECAEEIGDNKVRAHLVDRKHSVRNKVVYEFAPKEGSTQCGKGKKKKEWVQTGHVVEVVEPLTEEEKQGKGRKGKPIKCSKLGKGDDSDSERDDM